MKKSILITGCSSGIGLCAARILQARGWQVFASARDAADVERLKGEGLNAVQLDLTEPDSISMALDWVLKQTGGTLDALAERTEGGVLGEVTIVVAGHKGGGNPEDHAAAVLALADEGMRLKDAAAEVAAATGLRRNDLYRAALAARE